MSESSDSKRTNASSSSPTDWTPGGDVVRRIPLRPDGSTRLSTLLAATGDFARREVRRGKAHWQGVVTDLDTRIVPSFEPVELRFKGARYLVSADHAMILAAHKPEGLVSTHEDENPRASQLAGGSVFDLFPLWLAIEGVEPIGRLDKETSGLLLFTEHGVLSQRLRHPARAIERRYVATLARPLDAQELESALRDGVTLKDGTVVRPKALEVLNETRTQVRAVITEGRYHEVRRLFAAMGSHVEVLHREGYGLVHLPATTPAATLDTPTITDVSTLNEAGHIEVCAPIVRLVGDARRALLAQVNAEEMAPFAQIVRYDEETPEALVEDESVAPPDDVPPTATDALPNEKALHPVLEKLRGAKLRNFD